MNTLLVGYDLNKTGQNYKELIEFLKSDVNWWRHLDSTWLIKTEKSAKTLRDEIVVAGYVDANDELLVIDVTSDAAAWHGFNDKGSKWLKDNL